MTRQPHTGTGQPQRVQLQGHPRRPITPDGAVNIARPTRWQNPFKVGTFGREQALHHYLGWLQGDPAAVELARAHGCGLRLYGPALVAHARETLAGRIVACWCAPDEACHGDLLIAVVAGEEP